MNYLSLLTEDEARYICSVIPYEHTINYFQQNPKEFAKIRPGFRAKAISKSDASRLLFNNHNRRFVSVFIEEHVSDWLSQIKEHYNKCIENGDSQDLAYIHTLPSSYFADNVALYFKLIGEEHPEEYVAWLHTTVTTIKEANDEKEKLQEELKTNTAAIKQLQDDLDCAKSDLIKTTIKVNELSTEIRTLQRIIEELRSIAEKNEEVITYLKATVQEQEDTIGQLRKDLADAQNFSQQLEEKIRSELEKQQNKKSAKKLEPVKTKCPKDMAEFKDYLGYNLENIGVPTNSTYYPLLKEHLTKILFQGIPIVVNRGVGKTLMKCVANTLCGRSSVETLVFNKDLSIDEADIFLSSAKRVVCLDNFIGNYNETLLLPLFDNYRDKIIFLTVAYDRTMKYVSREFLRYCHYLNLNRIASLCTNTELTEDPSTIEEVEFELKGLSQGNRYSSILREMLDDFGFLPSMIEQRCAAIYDEQDLCRVLAFDVLPYCVDVLQISPFNASERLDMYAGISGRCPYKDLFRKWFAR
jgi:hypothetical protein